MTRTATVQGSAGQLGVTGVASAPSSTMRAEAPAGASAPATSRMTMGSRIRFMTRFPTPDRRPSFASYLYR